LSAVGEGRLLSRMPRAVHRMLRGRATMRAMRGPLRPGRLNMVAGAGVAALGGVAMGLVAWPLMDGYMMPWMASMSFKRAGNAALADFDKLSEQNPEAAEMIRKLQERLHTGNGSMIVVQEGTISHKHLLSMGEGRPLCSIDMSCVNDRRVMIWGLLHQMYQPLGSLGTAINSYVRAVYIAAALLTGNENVEHTDFMFFTAFLDYLSSAVRGASAHSRPLLVLRNVDELHSQAMEAEADGDKERATRLRSGAAVLFSIAERLSVVEGAVDCVIVSENASSFRTRERSEGGLSLAVSPRAITPSVA